MNPMKNINVEKITLNVGVGQPGDKLDKAMKLLQNISGLKPVQTQTMKRIPTWGLRPRLPVAAKVTIRGKKAKELLKRLLTSKGNKIPEYKFDKNGNFSFGVDEYINIPGVEYDVDIGIMGLEVAVTLTRPGYRVSKRKIKGSKVATKHKITKEEGINYMQKEFNVKLEEEK